MALRTRDDFCKHFCHMVEKKKALQILANLRERISGLKVCQELTISGEFTKWRRDVEAAIQNIFPNNRDYLADFKSLSFTPGVYYSNMPAGADSRAFHTGLMRADAVLASMLDQVSTYWAENGNSLNPTGIGLTTDPVPSTTTPMADQRTVFVVHGRNNAARRAMFEFLRAIGLNPLEWSTIVAATGKTSPYIGEVLEKGFSMAKAVVVLWTPDDEARLKEEHRKPDDLPHEAQLVGQARPNVLFEAGMAMGLHPNRTVLVEVGNLRPFTDVLGRHIVKLDNSVASRQELANRLKTAGCAVNLDGTDWHTVGSFELAVVSTKPVPQADQPSEMLLLEAGLYWSYLNGQRIDGPFCQVCYDREGKAIHLQEGSEHGGGHRWFCLGCHNGYGSDGSGMMSGWSESS